MGYLSYMHYNAMGERDLTSPQVELSIITQYMQIVQKLTSVAFSYHDGLVNQGKKSDEKCDDLSIDKLPTLLETISYTYNFFGIMGGPMVFFKHYKNQIENDENEISSRKAGFQKFKYSMTCVTLVFVTEKLLGSQAKYNNKNWVDTTPIYKKLILCSAYVPLQRTKYYFFWYLAEAINNFGGIGYDEINKNWDLIEQNRPFKTEFAMNPQKQINNWNVGSSRWLRYICYQRIDARKYGTLPVFVLSSLWHGFWFGQYAFLIGCHFMMMAYKKIRKSLSVVMEEKFGNSESPNGIGPKILKFYYISGAILFHFLMNGMGICFTILQSYENTVYFMKSCYFVTPIVIVAAGLFPWGSVFRPEKFEKVKSG